MNKRYKKAARAVDELTFSEWRQLKQEVDQMFDKRYNDLFKAAWKLTGETKIKNAKTS